MASSSRKPGEDSARFRFFTWLIFFLGLASVLVMNDAASPWPGAEALLLSELGGRPAGPVAAEWNAYWPALLYRLLPWEGALWLFWPRLLSVVAVVAMAGLFYGWGRDLFGRPTVMHTLLVVAASFFLPVMGKVATPDSWVLLLHTGGWLGYLRWSKRPGGRSGWIALALMGIAATVSPFSTLLLIALLFLLPALLGYRPLPRAAYSAIGLIWLISGLSLLLSDFQDLPLYWTPANGINSYGGFLLYNFLGVIPFVGFLLAGLRDMAFKAQKGEELSRLLWVAMVAAFLAQSPLFALLIALVVGKQLLVSFQPKYPWGNWLKTGQLLHLVLAFVAAVLVLIGSTLQLRVEGFRATMGLAAAYWMFSFIAVIGLYGRKRDYVVGGTVLAAALPALFFWVQIYPYLEVDRRWPAELVDRVQQTAQPREVMIGSDDRAATTALPALRRAGIAVTVTEINPLEATNTYRLLPLETMPGIAPPDTLSGRVRLGLQYWGLYPPDK